MAGGLADLPFLTEMCWKPGMSSSSCAVTVQIQMRLRSSAESLANGETSIFLISMLAYCQTMPRVLLTAVIICGRDVVMWQDIGVTSHENGVVVKGEMNLPPGYGVESDQGGASM